MFTKTKPDVLSHKDDLKFQSFEIRVAVPKLRLETFYILKIIEGWFQRLLLMFTLLKLKSWNKFKQ